MLSGDPLPPRATPLIFFVIIAILISIIVLDICWNIYPHGTNSQQRYPHLGTWRWSTQPAPLPPCPPPLWGRGTLERLPTAPGDDRRAPHPGHERLTDKGPGAPGGPRVRLGLLGSPPSGPPRGNVGASACALRACNHRRDEIRVVSPKTCLIWRSFVSEIAILTIKLAK